jgi:transposase
MTEKASVTNHMNEHWVFTFAVGCHYYIRNESEVGILSCVVRALRLLRCERNDNQKVAMIIPGVVE